VFNYNQPFGAVTRRFEMEKPKILICEDEEGMREGLNLILRKGYALSFAVNGQEAIDHVKAKKTDLVLLDIKMPKVSGLQALKEIKTISPDIKVIVVSGYGMADIVQEALELGACDYIVKPFERQKVLRSIQGALKKS